ncbi:hypothetical protein [Acetobacter vaccinii]|uniref:Chemotaxis protein n=1 Tax=Acetobacter vaccinii TaxID=2592655 RepID=A0A5C1YN66_9PROT|nr:hypothetical protein [Acetobacter vaccinii]QEO16925.1 hypothetical protein FLP30_03475 [Acetobacter vaccinii]
MTPEADGHEITVHEAIVRVTGLLDVVSRDLLGVQHAMDECVKGHHLAEDEAQSLQKLDSATQTVEALAAVLKNLTTHAGSGVASTIPLTDLHQGVSLGKVVRVLKGEPAPELVAHEHSGEVDLF